VSWFAPPAEIATQVHARLPDKFRDPQRTDWSDANRGGLPTDSFLEGPCFAEDGTLYVVDIPFGRIFAIDRRGDWRIVAQYDGWPNGMRVASDGTLVVADYRRGLMRVDPKSGKVACILGHAFSESFKGINDLQLLPDGSILFTDQGQTGMHDPSGRLYRYWPDGGLDRLIANAPSPNGVAVSREGTHAFLALTRAAQVWRVPLAPGALSAKTQVFAQLPGGLSGPDGLVVDGQGRLIVCDPGHGCAWVLSPSGVPLYRVVSCAGRSVTNATLMADGETLLMTESATGQVLRARIPN
jgi:gluconolactonase